MDSFAANIGSFDANIASFAAAFAAFQPTANASLLPPSSSLREALHHNVS